MKKVMTGLSIMFLSLFVISLLVYLLGRNDIWETLSIIFGVTSYHFLMRLLAGAVIGNILHNNVDHTKKWFAELPFEKSLYKTLHVKKWKKYMPTYNPDSFDMKKHSIVELIGAGCQAEIVHEVIIAFSFLPIMLTIWFKPGWVFVLTSVLAAMFDSIFVIMQRFNRPRLLRLVR